ncbi:MAG: hypothetical protein K8R37_05950 [Bacteroidales bacterium]|nr:hypothetical protein [Bacteroidales bacterium]
MTKRKLQGLSIINSHSGKKKVYDTYMKANPEMADMYLDFVSKHTGVQYISWDKNKNRFV